MHICFLGVCANTEYFRLEDFLESYGINKADLFIKIATYQEVDSDLVKTSEIDKLDFTVNIDVAKAEIKVQKRKKTDPMEGAPEEMPDPVAELMATMMGGSPRSESKAFNEYCKNLVEKAKNIKSHSSGERMSLRGHYRFYAKPKNPIQYMSENQVSVSLP